MHNFMTQNTTKIYFGDRQYLNLGGVLCQYGKKVLLVYGKNSIKNNGIYEKTIH